MLSIKQVSWQEEAAALRYIRQTVFIEEQAVPEDMEWETADHTAFHWLALYEQKLVGCARLLHNGKIGRMAVLPNFRQQSIGSALLKTILEFAEQQGFFKLTLSAQTHARTFYENFGFEAQGQQFMEAGILHISLQKKLREYALLGKQNYSFNVNDLSLGTVNMLQQTQRDFIMAFNHVDLALFNDPLFCEHLSFFARRYRHSNIRILLGDYKPLLQSQSPLIRLCRRLSSSIHIKQYELNGLFNKQNIILADNHGYIVQQQQDLTHITANYYHKIHVKNLSDEFNRYWQFAKPIKDINPLPL